MREYFCAYHSMIRGMRRLSDAECGRLFRALLVYSQDGTEPINLQGREEALFDVYADQIDRDSERYESKCRQMQANASRSKQKPAEASRSHQDKDKGKDEGKGNRYPGNTDEEEDIDNDQSYGAPQRREIVQQWQHNFGAKPNPAIIRNVEMWANELAEPIRITAISEAIASAALANANDPLAYVAKLLKDWAQHGIADEDALDEYLEGRA